MKPLLLALVVLSLAVTAASATPNHLDRRECLFVTEGDCPPPGNPENGQGNGAVASTPAPSGYRVTNPSPACFRWVCGLWDFDCSDGFQRGVCIRPDNCGTGFAMKYWKKSCTENPKTFLYTRHGSIPDTELREKLRENGYGSGIFRGG
jgi:hypothetical protein